MAIQNTYLTKNRTNLTDSELSAVKDIRKYFWDGDYKRITNVIDKFQRISEVIANNGCDDRSLKSALYVIEKGQDAIENLGGGE